MTPTDLKTRTKNFALRIIRLVNELPNRSDAKVIGSQILRSSTSVAANYRAACRARSKKEFISKLGVVVEEADETEFWLELIAEAGLLPQKRLNDIMKEAGEIVALMVSSRKSAITNKHNSSPS